MATFDAFDFTTPATSTLSGEQTQPRGFAEGAVNIGGEQIYSKPRSMLDMDDDPFGLRAKKEAKDKGLPEPTTDYVDSLLVFGKRYSREELSSSPWGSDLLETASRNRRGKKGFLKGLSEDFSLTELLPYVNDAQGIGSSVSDMLQVRDTFKKLQDGLPVTDEEAIKTRLFMARAERDASGSWGNTVGSIVRAAPAFAAEMYLTAQTAGAAAGASLGTRGSAKALTSAAKKQMALFTKEAFGEALEETAAKAGTKLGKDSMSRMAAQLDDSAIARAVEKAVLKMANPKESTEELAEFMAQKGAQEALIEYGGRVAMAQKNNLVNPSLFRAAKDYLSEYAGRAFTEHGAEVLWSMPKAKGEFAKEVLGNFLIEAPVRGALYMGFDQGVVHPLIGAATGQGLGFDTTATQAENQLRMSAMVRGDRGLMESAHAVSLGMSWMEYASEMTGRGFKGLLDRYSPAIKGVVKDVASNARLNGTTLSKLIDLDIGSDKAMKAKLQEKAVDRVRKAMDGEIEIPGFTDLKTKGFVSPEEALTNVPGLSDAAFKSALDQEKGIRFYQLWAAEKMVNNGLTPSGINKMLRNFGYDDLVEEMLEERYNGFAQGLFGFTDEDHEGVAKHLALMGQGLFPTWDQLSAEFVSFALPSIARSSIFRAQSILGAGSLSSAREFGEAMDTLNSFGVGALIGGRKASEASVVRIQPADPNDPSFKASEEFGRSEASTSVLADAYTKARNNLITMGRIYAESKDPEPMNIWRRGASSVLGVVNAVVSGNPMMAFADPFMATMKDYNMSPKLLSDAATVYTALVGSERAARTKEKGTLMSDEMAGPSAGLSRDDIDAGIQETYSHIAETLLNTELARRGIRAISDEDVRRQVSLIKETSGKPLTDESGAEISDEDFIAKYKDYLKAVLSGNARAIRSGTNLRFEYYSIRGEAGRSLVPDSFVRDSIANLLGMHDMFSVKSVARGESVEEGVTSLSPISVDLFKAVAAETDGSPITKNTIQLISMTSAYAMSQLGSSGGPSRLEQRAAEMRLAARAYLSAKEKILTPFFASFDDEGQVRASFRVVKTDTGFKAVDVFGPFTIDTEKMYESYADAVAQIGVQLSAFNKKADEKSQLSNFELKTPQIFLTTHDLLQFNTDWEALSALSPGYTVSLGKRALSSKDKDYKARLEAQLEEDNLADLFDEYKDREESFLIEKFGQDKFTKMQDAYTARYGADGYEAAKQRILEAVGIQLVVNSINPEAGTTYRLPLSATSTVDRVYMPVKFLDNMTAMLEDTVETTLRSRLGLVLDRDPSKKSYVAPVQIMVNKAKELCLARAALLDSEVERAASAAVKTMLQDRANRFRHLANNLLTRVSETDVNIESFSKLAVGVAMFRGDMYLANGATDTQTRFYAEIGEIADDLRRDPAFPAFASIVDRVLGGVGFTDPAHTSVDGLLPMIKQFQKASPEADKVYNKALDLLSSSAKSLRAYCKENKIPYSSSNPDAEISFAVQSSAKGGDVKQAPAPQKTTAKVELETPQTELPKDTSEVRETLLGATVGKKSKASMQSVVDTNVASLVYKIISNLHSGKNPSAIVKDTASIVDPSSEAETVRMMEALATAKDESGVTNEEELPGAEGAEGEDLANGEVEDDANDVVHETREGKHAFEFLTNQLVLAFSKVMGSVYPAVNNHPVSLKKMIISEVATAPAHAELLVGMLSPFLRTTELEQHGSMAEPSSAEFGAWKKEAQDAVASKSLDSEKFNMLFALLSAMPRADKLNLFHRLGSAVALEGKSIVWSHDKKVSFGSPSSRVATGKVYEHLAAGLRERMKGEHGRKLWEGTLGTHLNKGITTLTMTKPEHEGGGEYEFARKYFGKKQKTGVKTDSVKILDEFVARGKELAEVADLFFGDGNALSEALRDRRTWREALSNEARFDALVNDFMFTTKRSDDSQVNVKDRAFFPPFVVGTLKDIRDSVIKAATKTSTWSSLNTDEIFSTILAPLSSNVTKFVRESETTSTVGTGSWLRGFGTILNSYASVNPPTSTKKPGTSDSMPLVQAGTSAIIDRFIKSPGFLAANRMLKGFERLQEDSLALKMARATGTYVDGTPVIGNIVGELYQDGSGNTAKTESEAAPTRAYAALKAWYEKDDGEFVMVSLPTGDRKRCVVVNMPRKATRGSTGERIPFKAFIAERYKKLGINRMEPKRHPPIVGNGFALDIPGETTIAVVANGFDKGVGESTNGMLMMFGRVADLHETVSADKSMEGKYHFYHPETGEFLKSAQVSMKPSTSAFGDPNVWKQLAFRQLQGVWSGGSLLATDMANLKTGYMAASVTVDGKKYKIAEYIVKLHKDNGSDESLWEPAVKSADGTVTKESLLDTKVRASFKGGAVVEGTLGELLPNLKVSNIQLEGHEEEYPVITYKRAGMRMQEAANLHKSAKPKFNKIGVNLIKDAVHLYGLGAFVGRYGMAKMAVASKILATDRLKMLGESAVAKLRSLTTLGWGPGSGPFEAAYAKSALSALRNMARLKSYGLISVQASSGMRVVSIGEDGEPVLDSMVGTQHERDMLYMPRAIGPERSEMFNGQTSISGLARANAIDAGQRYLMWAKGDGAALVSEFGMELGDTDFRSLLGKVVLKIVSEEASGTETSDTRRRFFSCFSNWDGTEFAEWQAGKFMLADLVFTGNDGNAKFDYTALFDQNIKLLEDTNGKKGVALAGSPAIVSRTPSYNNGANAAVVRFSTPYSTKDGKVMDTAIVMLDPLTDFRLGTDHDGDKITMEMLKASKGIVNSSDLSTFTVTTKDGESSLDEEESASNYFVHAKIVAARNPDLRTMTGGALQDGQALVGTLNSNPVSAEPLSAEGMAQIKAVRDSMFAKIKEATGVDLTFKLDMLDPEFLAWLTGDAIDTSKARGIGVMLINFINDARQLGMKVKTPNVETVTSMFEEAKSKVVQALAKKKGPTSSKLAFASASDYEKFYDELMPILMNVFNEDSGMLRDSSGKSYKSSSGVTLFKPMEGHESMDPVAWSLKAKVFDGVNNAMFDALKELLAPSLGWNTTGIEPLFLALAVSNFKTEAEYVELFSKFIEWYYSAGYSYVRAQRYRAGLDDGKGLVLVDGEIPSLQELANKVDEPTVEALRMFSEGAKLIKSLTPAAVLGNREKLEELAQLVVASVKEGNSPKVSAIQALSFYRLLVTSAGYKAAVEGLSPERFKIRDLDDIKTSEGVLKTAASSQEGIGIEIPVANKEVSGRLDTGESLLKLARQIVENTVASQVPEVPKDLLADQRAPQVANCIAVADMMIAEFGEGRVTELFNTLGNFSVVSNRLNIKLGIEALVSAAVDASGKSGDTPIALSNIRLPAQAKSDEEVATKAKQTMTLRAPDASLGVKQAISDSIDRMLSGEEDKTRSPVEAVGRSEKATVTWKELGYLLGFYGAASASDIEIAPNTVLSMFSPAFFSEMSYKAALFTDSGAFIEVLNQEPELLDGGTFETPLTFRSGWTSLLTSGKVVETAEPTAKAKPTRASDAARDALVSKLHKAETQFKAGMSNSDFIFANSMIEAAGQLVRMSDDVKKRPSSGPGAYEAPSKEDGLPMMDKAFAPATDSQFTFFWSMLNQLVYSAASTHDVGAAVKAAGDYVKYLNIGMKNKDDLVSVDPTVLKAAIWLSRAASIAAGDEASTARLNDRFSLAGIKTPTPEQEASVVAMLTSRFEALGVKTFAGVASLGQEGRVELLSWVTYAVNQMSTNPNEEMLNAELDSGLAYARGIARAALEKGGQIKPKEAIKAEEEEETESPAIAPVKEAVEVKPQPEKPVEVGAKISNKKGAVVAKSLDALGSLFNLPGSVVVTDETPVVEEVAVAPQVEEALSVEAVAAQAAKKTTKAMTKAVKPAKKSTRTPYDRVTLNAPLSREEGGLANAIDSSVEGNAVLLSLNGTRVKEKGATLAAILEPEKEGEQAITTTKVESKQYSLGKIYDDPISAARNLAHEVAASKHIDSSKPFSLSLGSNSFVELQRQARFEEIGYNQEGLYAFADAFMSELKSLGLKKLFTFNLSGLNYLIAVAAVKNGVSVTSYLYDTGSTDKASTTAGSFGLTEQLAKESKVLQGFTINYQEGTSLMKYRSQLRARMKVDASTMEDMNASETGLPALSFKNPSHVRSMKMLEAVRRIAECLDLFGGSRGLRRTSWSPMQVSNLTLLERTLSQASRAGEISAYLPTKTDTVAPGTEFFIRSSDINYGDGRTVSTNATVETGKLAVVFLIDEPASVEEKLANPILATVAAMNTPYIKTLPTGASAEEVLKVVEASGADSVCVFSPDAGRVVPKKERASVDSSQEFKFYAVTERKVKEAQEIDSTSPVALGATVGASSNALVDVMYRKNAAEDTVEKVLTETFRNAKSAPRWNDVFSVIDRIYQDNGLVFKNTDTSEAMAKALQKYYDEQTSFGDTENEFRSENWAMSMAGALMRLSHGYGYSSYDRVVERINNQLSYAMKTGDGRMITAAERAVSILKHINSYGFEVSDFDIVEEDIQALKQLGLTSSKEGTANKVKTLVDSVSESLMLLAYFKFHAADGRVAHAMEPSMVQATVEALPEAVKPLSAEEEAVLANVQADKNMIPIHRQISYKIADYDAWFNHFIRPTFNGASVRDIMTNGSVQAGLMGLFDDLNFERGYYQGDENGVLATVVTGETTTGAKEGKIGTYKNLSRKFSKLERIKPSRGGHFSAFKLDREHKDENGNIVEDMKGLMKYVMSEAENIFIKVRDTGRSQSAFTGAKLKFADFLSRHSRDFAEVLSDKDKLKAAVAEFFSDASIKRRAEASKFSRRLDLDVAIERLHEYIPLAQYNNKPLIETLREKIVEAATKSLTMDEQKLAEELYTSGWAAKQNLTKDGKVFYTNLVLTVPMEVIEDVFEKSAAKKRLIEAGRDPELLTLKAIALKTRALAARVHRTGTSLPWVTKGLGAGLTAANSSSPFFRGSAIRDYTDRNTVEELEPSAQQKLDKEAESLLRSITASLVDVMDETGQFRREKKALEKTPPRMIRFMLDLYNMGHVPEADFIERVKAGEFESGKNGFILAKNAGMADLASLIYSKSVEELYSDIEGTGKARKSIVSGIPLSAFTKAYEAAIQANDFRTGVPGLTSYQAYERDGSLPAGNYSALDRVQLYANELLAAEELRGTLAQMLMTTDQYGNPLYLAKPTVGMELEDALPDEMWGVLARWWSSSFGVNYDLTKSGRENASEIYDAVSDRQMFQGGSKVQYSERGGDSVEVTGYHRMTETGLASISGFLCRLDEPWDDTKAALNTLSHGEAAGMLSQLLRAKKSVYTSSFSSVVDHILSWSKSLSVTGSVFFTIATTVESPMAAIGPTFWKWFNKDPNFIGMRDVLNLIGSNDPFFKQLKTLAILQGIPLSDRTKNPIEHFNKGSVDRDIRAITKLVRNNLGNKAADGLNAALKGAMQSSSEYAFEYLINATTLAVMAQLNNKFRAQALAQGKPWDPVYNMRKWSAYISAEVGGVNPAIMPFMTPKVQRALAISMFSWPWTIGAWLAGGGDVLTQKFFGQTSNPYIRQFMFGRWLRMYGGIMVGLPIIIQIVSKAIAKAAGDDDDDDKWFTWQNEDKANLSAGDITPALKAIAKVPFVKGFKQSGGYIEALPEWANAILRPVTWSAAKMLPAYTGTDTANTTGRRRIYFHLGKQGWEVLRWFDSTWSQTVSKLAMPVQKFADAFLGYSLGTGYAMPWKEQGLGERLTTLRGDSAWKHFLSSFVPFSFQGMVDKGDVGALGMIGPTAYGVGQSASVANMKGVLEKFADPSSYSRVYSSKNMYNDLISRVRDEMEAARINGLDPERMLSFALGQAREPYYRKVYDAIPKAPGQEPDDAELESAMRSLYRLWFVERSLLNSVKSRLGKTNNPFETMDPELKAQILHAIRSSMANPTGEEEAQRAVRRVERGGRIEAIDALSTDVVPQTVLGYRVVGPEHLSIEDEMFFDENPEAAGFYSMNDDDKGPTPPNPTNPKPRRSRALDKGGAAKSVGAVVPPPPVDKPSVPRPDDGDLNAFRKVNEAAKWAVGVVDADSSEAEKEKIRSLLVGTAAAESALGTDDRIKDLKTNPNGVFQVLQEPFKTATRRLVRDKALQERLKQEGIDYKKLSHKDVQDYKKAALMARLIYKQAEEPIPEEGHAAYWKKYYNTEAGDGTVEKFVQKLTERVVPAEAWDRYEAGIQKK